MAAMIEFFEAREQDLEALVAINAQTNQHDELSRAILSPSPQSAELSRQWDRLSLESNLRDSNAHVVKACVGKTQEIVGFTVLHFNPTGEMEELRATAPIAGVDNDLLKKYTSARDEMQTKAVDGKPHYSWLYPRVLPEYQNDDLEDDIVKWAFSRYNADKEHVWTFTTQPKELEFFENLGWYEVGRKVLDLPGAGGQSPEHSQMQLMGLVKAPGPLRS